MMKENYGLWREMCRSRWKGDVKRDLMVVWRGDVGHEPR